LSPTARVASAPIRTASFERSNVAAEMSPKSGAISTSLVAQALQLLVDRLLAEES
jgi:hypothetical protein